MHPNMQIFLRKSFLRYPFQRISRPISSFHPKVSTPTSTQCTSNPFSPQKPINFSPSYPKFLHLLHPTVLNPSAHPISRQESRELSSESAAGFDPSKEIDEINLKFAEAREEIEMALESKDTVYFDEEVEIAREAAKVVLDMFEGLLAKLPESERAALQRSMGLKIEQLKAELQQLDD